MPYIAAALTTDKASWPHKHCWMFWRDEFGEAFDCRSDENDRGAAAAFRRAVTRAERFVSNISNIANENRKATLV
jgi:hypothetical protein